TMWLAPAIEDLTRQNATYVVVGSALAEAQRGELAVHGGALVVGPVAATFLSPGHFVAVGEGFVRVERDDLPARSHDRPALTPSTPNPSARWRYVIPGAYDDRLRPAFSHVSVAFVELRTWPTPETMATIIELTGESGGHVSSLLRTAPDQEGLTMILVWGAPVGHDNDARRTLWFVEAAQQKLGVGSFRTGAGYANLFSGFVGSEQQSTYTVVGAPVNLAARLCSLASWGEIRVTEVFDDVVPEQWLVESVDPILYKGFQVPLATRSLRPMSGADTDQRGRSHLATSGDSPLLTGPRTELRARAAGRHPPDADDEPSVVD
ncbi:MAG TPA: adenylate/guanylate cyclase domain-containing protein, partial [Ilumatobacter sp.]|nr:adenylate/guanylate cyclase domain-containing protein [Ilumatobacter sp.]